MTLRGIAKTLLQDTRLFRSLRAELHKESHINRALRALDGQTYVEIGVANGTCFRQIQAPRKIGVDPGAPSFGHDLAAGESFFRVTSDDFFVRHAPALPGTDGVDVALVDGYHEFTQALRDVLNLERYMKPGGVIFIHDCNPPTRQHVEVREGDCWTGDVWKVVHYLREQRRDLDCCTLDLDWGVGVVTGFRRGHVPPPPAAADLERYRLLDYDVLRRNRRRILGLRPFWLARFALHRIRRRFDSSR
jgi:SAM-dependent methyltransferase